MYHKDLFKDSSPYHLEDYGWYIDYLRDNNPPFEVMFKESRELSFQEKFASFGALNIQVSKKKSVAKGKGKKTNPLEIIEVLEM
jgi:hypothetical protein